MTSSSSAFEAAFTPDTPVLSSDGMPALSDPYLRQLLAKWGGSSFNRGIYRLIRNEDVPKWSATAESTFPGFANRLIPFGFDWLGRLFALDRQRTIEGAPAVTLFEPGTGEALEIPCSAESFHEVELIDYREEALAASFFQSWLEAGGTAPTPTQCIGYRIPLFLGGADTVENLEIADLEAYWGLAEQLLRKTKGLPIGTKIGDVLIRE